MKTANDNCNNHGKVKVQSIETENGKWHYQWQMENDKGKVRGH